MHKIFLEYAYIWEDTCELKMLGLLFTSKPHIHSCISLAKERISHAVGYTGNKFPFLFYAAKVNLFSTVSYCLFHFRFCC